MDSRVRPSLQAQGGFKLSDLVVTGSVVDATKTEQRLALVSLAKPHDQQFVRAHPDPEQGQILSVFTDKENKTSYLVAPGMVATFGTVAKLRELVPAMGMNQVPFLWNAPAPGSDNAFNISHRMALDAARTHWVRMTNIGGSYTFVKGAVTEDPSFEGLDLQTLVDVIFPLERIITDMEHPVVQNLQLVKVG
jgi:hypothetical protein